MVKIEETMENKYTINLLSDRPIIGILAEVCWGLKVNNFEAKIGEKKEIVEKILMRLVQEEKLGIIETSLNSSEVEILKKAFDIVKEEIEEWEFYTRFGVHLNEVEELAIFKK